MRLLFSSPCIFIILLLAVFFNYCNIFAKDKKGRMRSSSFDTLSFDDESEGYGRKRGIGWGKRSEKRSSMLAASLDRLKPGTSYSDITERPGFQPQAGLQITTEHSKEYGVGNEYRFSDSNVSVGDDDFYNALEDDDEIMNWLFELNDF